MFRTLTFVVLPVFLLATACSKKVAAPVTAPATTFKEVLILPLKPAPEVPEHPKPEPSRAEEPAKGYAFVGLGVVGHEIAGEAACYFMENGHAEIALHGSPGGAKVATMGWEKGEYGSCRLYLLHNGVKEPVQFGREIMEISSEAAALVYFESRDGYARVLDRRYPTGAWVRIADVPGGALRPWTALLTEPDRNYQGHGGKVLRSEPSQGSPALVTIRGEGPPESIAHELKPTGRVSGDWGEFEVIEYDGEYRVMQRTREPAKTGSTWKGWLRLMEESGQPAFWFYSRD